MKKKKRKFYSLRFRKDDHTHNLQVAAHKWLKANGGKALVLGGIGIMDNGPYKFSICINITGKRPVKNPASRHEDDGGGK